MSVSRDDPVGSKSPPSKDKNSLIGRAERQRNLLELQHEAAKLIAKFKRHFAALRHLDDPNGRRLVEAIEKAIGEIEEEIRRLRQF